MIDRIDADPLLLSTSCFTMAHLKDIAYYIFQFEDQLQSASSGSSIYELEAEIRKEYPTAIMVVYSKDLYLYDLNCGGEPPSVHDRVMEIITSKKVDVEISSSGSFHSKTTFTQLRQPNKSLPLVYMNFLKAVKKFFVWKLAEHRDLNGLLQVLVFGNHAITTTTTSQSSRLLLIDTVYNFNDELLINVCTKNHGLERMITDTENFNSNDYALYLAPSAVRVYLANNDLKNSTLETPPLNYMKLLKLLKDFANINLIDVKDLKWVKVIPDLGHLNYLTPTLSRYLKSPNKGLKYLVWPLALCFRQQGVEDLPTMFTKDVEFEASSYGHIFNIIEEFIEFNNDVETVRKKESESMSSMNTPASIAMGTPVANPELIEPNLGITNKEERQQEEFNEPDELFDEKIENLEKLDEQQEEEEDLSMDDKWDTELFGGDDEDENDPASNEELAPNTSEYFSQSLIDDEIDKLFPDSDIDELDSVTTKNNELKNEQQESSTSEKNDSSTKFIDTSKFIRGAGTDNSFYEDPGAPAPVPFAIIAENALNEETMSEADKKKSVFAPLRFNPAIEQSIDSKYLSGGKFYIQPDGETEASWNETADTSIKSYTPVTPSLRKGNFQSTNVDSSSEDSDSSMDEDDDLSSRGSLSSKKNEQKGLGIVLFKKDELIPDNDKLNNLALSSPTRKGDLSLQSNFVNALNSNITLRSDSSTPSPSPASSENQNWLPFLLKQIPLYTIPAAFLNKDAPKIPQSQLNDLLPVLVRMLVFDSFNDNSQCSDSDQKRLLCLKFQKNFTQRYDNTISDLVERSFPGVSRTTFFDVVKQITDVDNSLRENFECLTGDGLKGQQSNFEYMDLHKTDSIERSPFPSGSPFVISNQGFGMYDSPSGSNSVISDHGMEITKNLFQVPQPRIILNRLDKEIKLNYTSLGFWNFLNLQPAGLDKDFEVLFVTPRFGSNITQEHNFFEKSVEFLDSVADEYKSLRLGTITRYDEKLPESKSVINDIEVSCKLENGVYEIVSEAEVEDSEMWKIVNEKLLALSKSIKESSVESKSRPILLLVSNPTSTFKSFVELGKTLTNFTTDLSSEVTEVEVEADGNKKKKRKISTTKPTNLQVFTKVLSFDTFYSPEQTYTILSTTTINRIAFDLYNLSPATIKKDEVFHNSLIDYPFTSISPGVPEKISYMLTKASVTKNVVCRDLYIHLAYERSIDKNWCVASWSDQYGNLTNVKAWYCPPQPFGSKENTPSSSKQQNFKSFEEVCNEIWDITLGYIRSYTGKSYLVLTRLNNIIPDDELVHWKRLSVKTKNLLLILLAVNLNSNFILDTIDSQYLSSMSSMMSPTNQRESGGKRFKNEPDSVTSNTGLTPFLVGNGDSPELYMTGGVATPMDITSPNNVSTTQSKFFNTTEDVSIIDVMDDVYGLVVPFPIPLSNQQTRVSIKTGYLIKASLQQDSTIGNGNESFTPVAHSFQQPQKIQSQKIQEPQQQQQQPQQQQNQKQEQDQVIDGQQQDKLKIEQDQQPNFEVMQEIPDLKIDAVLDDAKMEDAQRDNDKDENKPKIEESQQVNQQDHQINQRRQQALSNKPLDHQQRQQQSHTKFVVKSENILEVNLMSCPNFLSGVDLMKSLLIQYRDLSSLACCWGMSGNNNLHTVKRDDGDDEVMLPWHILSVRKCLNGLEQINVVD